MLLGMATLKGEVSLTRKEVEAAKDHLETVRTVKSKYLQEGGNQKCTTSYLHLNLTKRLT